VCAEARQAAAAIAGGGLLFPPERLPRLAELTSPIGSPYYKGIRTAEFQIFL
jgi:hypothetical protein